VLWYFLEPFVDERCGDYTVELIDRDELDGATAQLASVDDLNNLESRIADLE
jgi:hypothetical protein